MIERSGVVDCNRSVVPRVAKWDADVPVKVKALKRLREYAWYCAFAPAAKLSHDVDTIDEVIAMVDGENDESPWVGVFKAKDGKLVVVHSSCDYTGWDCQSGGEAYVCDTLDEAKSVIDANDLVRLGL